MKQLRIAHISDLHFSKPTYGIGQFFSKRWLGNFNLILFRRREFRPHELLPSAEFFKELGVTHLVISGDLSQTSRKAEFREAQKYIDSIRAAGIDVLAVPGNHDHYTKSAEKKQLFYRFFDDAFSGETPFSLTGHRLTAKKVRDGFWIIGLDTALATSLFSSQGHFSEELESHLEALLKEIPSKDRIVLVNHFPVFNFEPQSKELRRSHALKQLLRQFPNVVLYLHGHTHIHSIADLRGNHYPIMCDAGSAVHNKKGSWNLLDLDGAGCKVTPFRWKEGQWQQEKEQSFRW